MNNIVYKNGGSGIHTYKSKHVDIINNTAYLNCQSPELNDGQIFANSSDDIRIFNNILVAPANKRINSNYNNGKSIGYSNNLHFGGNATAISGTNLIKGDPLFVDATNNDFRLLKESPAINKGIDSLTGVAAPANDFSGKNRPVGAGFDIGAFEYELTSGLGFFYDKTESDFFTLYPNPATLNVNVKVNAVQNQKVEINLFNIQGQLISTNLFFAVAGGLNSFSLPVHQIPNGFYILKVNNGNEILSKNLVKN